MQKRSNDFDESLGGGDCGRGLLGLNDRARPRLAIRNRFDVIALWQKPAQLRIEARLVPGEARKLHLHALVRLGRPSCALADQSLRGMKSREIGVAPAVSGDTGR
jgi:hypothetical protein